MGLVRSRLSMFFLNVHHDSQRLIFKNFLKNILSPDAFEAFLHGSIFDKTALCLGEKQGMLVKDECSSWYNRVGYF